MPKSDSLTAARTAEPEFPVELRSVARTLRSALSTLLTSSGLDPQDPQSLVRGWGVNRQLAWKISKVIQIDDPYGALHHLPGTEGLAILLRKATEAGVPARIVEATREAATAFDRLVETHCGDRSIFDIMGSAMSSSDLARQHQEALRKQFFLGASAIWGAHTAVNQTAWFVAPSDPAGADRSFDMVSIKSWIGFRRLCENLSWVVSRHMSRRDDGTYWQMSEPEPLDPRSDSTRPLMLDFCSDPPPPLSVREDQGRVTVSIAPGPVGNVGQVTCSFGRLHRRVAAPTQDPLMKLGCTLGIPSEMAIFDVYIHESMRYALPPEVVLTSLLEARGPGLEPGLLPLLEPLVELGAPTPAPLTLEVPRYAEMLDLVFDRTGWRPDEFLGYRLKMAYPPMPAQLLMQCAMP